MARFEPHGNPRATMQGRIMEVRPDGPGNFEGVASLLEEMGRMIASEGQQSWAVLLIAEAQTLLTPDAENALAEGMPLLRATGHVATAAVLVNNTIRAIFEDQFQRIHARSGVPFAVFPSVVDAEAWLHDLLS